MLGHVWILVRLRWKLLLASFVGKSGKQAAAIIGLVLIMGWAVILGVWSFFMVRGKHGVDPAVVLAAQPAIMRLIFVGTFLLQLMTSVVSLSVSDFFDTSRLMHLPVRARSIFFAMLVSSALAPSTLVFASPALGAMAALHGPPSVHVFRLGVVLGLVMFGQATALFAGYILLRALSRRRLRDAATIFGSVLGLGFYMLIRVIRPRTGIVEDWAGSGPLWDVLGFVPTSWFADLLQAGGPPRGMGVLDVLPAILALATSLVGGAWSFSRFYAGSGESTESEPSSLKVPARSRVLRAEIGALARQTLSIIWREPQLKAMLFQQMIFLLVPFLSLQSEKGMGAAAFSVPFFMVFSHAWLALSLLGIDGPGLKLLLQSPAPRSRILLGRVLALGWLFTLIDVVAMAVLVLVTSLWSGVGDPFKRFFELTAACVIADWILVGAGAYVSVVVPSPLVRRSKQVRMRQEGCATNLGKVIFRLPVMVVAVGVGCGAALPGIADLDPVWFLASVPGGILVAVLVTTFAVAGGARRLVAREEQIMAALVDAGD